MNARQQDILSILTVGDYTGAELAARVNAPAPSVRRAIASLRKQGHDVTFNNGFYQYDEPSDVNEGGVDLPIVDAYDTDIDSSDEDDLGDDKFYDDGGW